MLKKIIHQGIIIFILSIQYANAQSMDCLSTLRYRQASYPYEISGFSKSAICITGNTYEYVIPLFAGKEYRFSFFASSAFNHQINFRIIDLNTNELVLEIPGESEINENGISALRDYFNDKLNKLVHPYFDFFPAHSTKLKIIIEIPSVDEKNEPNNSILCNIEKIMGCVTIFVQDKKADDFGFR